MALSRVEDVRKNNEHDPFKRMRENGGGLGTEGIEGGTMGEGKQDAPEEKEVEEVMLCQEVSSSVTQNTLLCMETNVHYPTSTGMKLLLLCDDGLSGQSQEEGEGNGGGVEEFFGEWGGEFFIVLCYIYFVEASCTTCFIHKFLR